MKGTHLDDECACHNDEQRRTSDIFVYPYDDGAAIESEISLRLTLVLPPAVRDHAVQVVDQAGMLIEETIRDQLYQRLGLVDVQFTSIRSIHDWTGAIEEVD